MKNIQRSKTAGSILPQLMVAGAGNSFEQEAKGRANQLTGTGVATVQPPRLVAGQPTGSGQLPAVLQRQIEREANQGQPMDHHTLSYMEHKLGGDLGHVSVHTGTVSRDLNRTLQSNAFTVGDHIFFNEGKWQPGSNDGKKLLAHELTHTMQQESSQSIQKDDDEAGSGTDFDFELLPPHIQLTLPHFLLDADTDRVRTQFTWNDLQSSLQYSYGSSIDLGLRYRMFSTQLGFNPSSSVLNYSAAFRLPSADFALSGSGSYNFTDSAATLGLTGSTHGIRFGGSYNFGTSALGLNIGYGAPLLPTPDEMGTSFGGAGSAIPGLVGSVPGIMPDPMAWYAAQQERIDAVSQGVAMFNKLREEPGSGIRFGAAGRLTYSPASGLFFFVGARGSF